MTRDSVTLFSFIFCLLFLGLYHVEGELVQWGPCSYPEGVTPSNCTVHEVNIDPCKEAAENKPCKLKRGIVGNMTFHYTPTFSSDKLEGRIYWVSQLADIPFLGLNSNACLMTNCPIEAGQKNIYRVQVPILKEYPVRTYNLKWKIWNDQEEECCFQYQIKITK
ncbi:MD-2-related lipid-recognition protein-like [Ceratina calcarata]|uniref:MD-2-related lipid-recognition protein-like n=1 Tax=Ceratina calcarata TaxID=156304 RepID=A0AAJ7J806_9HYME|nr:MD-2-related lipid-recognition protein-like [Ceratina calcarata]